MGGVGVGCLDGDSLTSYLTKLVEIIFCFEELQNKCKHDFY